jgi:hypothetical protein
VAIYEYRCEIDGRFEVTRAIGTAPASVDCPVCGRAGGRVFTMPSLARVPRALGAALDHEEKTRTEPDLVTSLPPAPAHKRTPTVPLTPTLARLPRP